MSHAKQIIQHCNENAHFQREHEHLIQTIHEFILDKEATQETALHIVAYLHNLRHMAGNPEPELATPLNQSF